ncbi:MAG: hypothetical protein H6766_06060 [Candidatus Peribacteria bacterium]|nr:MAG: hypothetical protein H6766_06060 [Candidatus Peribacteria bacterium]
MSIVQSSFSLKTGNECFINSDNKLPYTLLDFWRWNNSDLLSNAARGRLAEFIVAIALGVDIQLLRSERDAYDLLTPT